MSMASTGGPGLMDLVTEVEEQWLELDDAALLAEIEKYRQSLTQLLDNLQKIGRLPQRSGLG